MQKCVWGEGKKKKTWDEGMDVKEEEGKRKTEKEFAFQNDSRVLTHAHGTAQGHVTTRL